MEPAEYDRIAKVENDHWWFQATRSLMQQFLAPWLRPGITSLDAGCGPGGNGVWLAQYGRTVGLDIERAALEYAQRRPEMYPVQGSISELPFPDASFDIVIGITVLYHVSDHMQAAQEVARVLKPGGATFFIEPALEVFRRAHDTHVHGIRRYKKRELADLFKTSGLTIRRATYARSFLAPPALALGLAYRAHPTSPEQARSDLDSRKLDRFTDPAFQFLAHVEDQMLARHNLPFGTSAIVLAEKS